MTKLLSMRQAIEQFVPDGASVVMGAALESLIPFAAGHEIIRQGKRDLTLIGPISDMLFDQLIGAGCVRKVIAAWVGNVSAGLAHNYRRAVEGGVPHPIEIEDHTNFTVGLALLAASLGAPYIPTRTALGTDILKTNPTLKVTSSPLDGSPVVLVPALQPDVAILHVQRCDPDGNAHAWGNLGISEEAAQASRTVVVIAEEIVDRKVIFSDPNRVLVPGFKLAAVVHEPGGAHPSSVQGHYNRDHDAYHTYHQATRTQESFQGWLAEWVLGVPDRAGYLERLEERWPAL
ncbi:MAG: CoA transferase subunit A, partial [Anaerolineae bacterium]